MGEALRIIESVIPTLQRHELERLKSLIDSELGVKKTTRTSYKPRGAKSAAWWKRIDGIDLNALANGRGWWSVQGEFVDEEAAKECIALHKDSAGLYTFYTNGKPAMPDQTANFEGRFAHVNTHAEADVLWRIFVWFRTAKK
jgi:hypothetical protein